MINVENVTKRYGKFLANKNISFNVKPGEMAVLLGPNGAGKSTLIKSICGLLRFDGRISIFGNENHSIEAKRLIGYIPEIPAVYNMLTVSEHIEFIAKAYRLKNWKDYADLLLRRFELDDKTKKLGKDLSKGMQQKLSICCALLSGPKAIIFDEPLVGLDPHAIRELKDLIRELKAAGCAIIISTHMIDSIEADWNVTYIMKGGEIIKSFNIAELNGSERLEDLYFEITENSNKMGGTN